MNPVFRANFREHFLRTDPHFRDPSSVENVGVVGDFGHSNVVDEDLNMQPDQNKGDVMGGGTSGVENVGVVGDFGHSNISLARCRIRKLAL